MPSMKVTPDPAVVGSVVRIDGTGFDPKKRYELALDGVGYTTNRVGRPAKDGTFHKGMAVGTTPKVSTITARVQDTTTVIASVDVTVVASAPTPQPTPPTITNPRVEYVAGAVTATGKCETSVTTSCRLVYRVKGTQVWTTRLPEQTDPTKYAAHAMVFPGSEGGQLAPATDYEVQFFVADAAGTPAWSPIVGFRTADATPIPDPGPVPVPDPAGVKLPPSLVDMTRLQSDATDGPDMTSALLQFFSSVPGGTTILFDPGRKYRVESQLKLPNLRTGFYVDGQGRGKGQGALLYRASMNGDPNMSLWRFNQCNDTKVLGFRVDLKATNPGHYETNFEWQHVVDILGGTKHEVGWIDAKDCKGDLIYAASWGQQARDVYLHDSWGQGICRCGVAAVGVEGLLAERVTLKDHGMQAFDMEPNSADQWVDNVVVQDTVLTGHNAYWFSINGDGDVKNITMRRNRSETQWGLHTYIHQSYGQQMGRRRLNVKVLDNVATQAGPGPTGAKMYFQYVDGLTVTGNTQPLLSGQPLVELDGCTSAVTSPNP